LNLSKLSVLVVLLIVTPLTGAAEPPPKEKDPQSSFEPRSGPGTGQKFLEKFVGDWDVVKTFHPRTGDPVRMEGTCRQTMLHKGRFLNSEFVFGAGEDRTTGLGLIGFDPESGKFTSVWTDSRSTRMSLRRSEDKFNGEEIVMFSQPLADGGRERRRSRTVTRLENNGSKIIHRQYVPDSDGKERLIMELLLTRKAAAAPGK